MRDLLRISEYLSEEWGVFNCITKSYSNINYKPKENERLFSVNFGNFYYL